MNSERRTLHCDVNFIEHIYNLFVYGVLFGFHCIRKFMKGKIAWHVYLFCLVTVFLTVSFLNGADNGSRKYVSLLNDAVSWSLGRRYIQLDS